MITKPSRERMLSDAERELLTRYATADAKEYPIEKLSGAWTWSYGALQAPRMYTTKKEAAQQFAAYLAVLEQAKRASAEQHYDAEAAEGADPVMPADPPPTADAQLLSEAIKQSQLSVRKFASQILVREPRTVWRWLSGENPLPAAVREKCIELLKQKDK